MHTNNLHIFYFGGSGGFFLLHLLLLSDEFFCAFDHPYSLNNFNDILNCQWSAKPHELWKSTEIWPNNLATSQSTTSQQKVFLHCNPEVSTVEQCPGTKLFLYTDIETQLRLSLYKRSWIFNNTTSEDDDRIIADHWRWNYKTIRSGDWPRFCNTPKDMYSLPPEIKVQVIKHPNTAIFFSNDKVEQIVKIKSMQIKTTEFNHQRVFGQAVNLLRRADVQPLNLQDLINDPATALAQIQHTAINTAQNDFIKRWKNLHPASMLEQMNFKL